MPGLVSGVKHEEAIVIFQVGSWSKGSIGEFWQKNRIFCSLIGKVDVARP